MKTAILALAVSCSIATAGAATEKVLTTPSGNTAALVSSTAVAATDSALVRAAKLTVARRVHSGTTNVINDSTVSHHMKVLGESAPGVSAAPAASAASMAATTPAAPAAAAAPSAAPAAAAAGQGYAVAGPPAPPQPQRH